MKNNSNSSLSFQNTVATEKDIKSITTITDPETGINFLQLDESKLFNYSMDGNGPVRTKIVNAPIFEVDGSIYYVIPLKNFHSNDPANPEPIQPIALYGPNTILGVSPLSFSMETDCANPKAIISDVDDLLNDNQQSAIEMGIRESLNKRDIIKEESPTLFLKPSLETKGDIAKRIYEKLRYYLKLNEDWEYYIATCFILGTYLFPIFATFGYLVISGEKGAGKGTFLDFLERTCWNASAKQISVTEAVLFRRIDGQLPTLIIDEYHRAITNKNSGTSLISIMESGYERGGVVSRAVQYKEGGEIKFNVTDYDIYCPKVIATRKPVEADAKGIKIIMDKQSNDVKYAKRKKELYNDSFFHTVRSDILKWAISNQKDILSAYNEIDPDKLFSGREYNVWLPALAISKIAFPEIHDLIMKYAGKSIAKTRSDTYEKENRILNAIHYLYSDDKLVDGGKKLKKLPSFKISNSEIKKALSAIDDELMHHNTIKSALDNLKILGQASNGIYFIKKENLFLKFAERDLILKTEDFNKYIKPNNVDKTSEISEKEFNNISKNFKLIPTDKDIFQSINDLGIKANLNAILKTTLAKNSSFDESFVKDRIGLLFTAGYLLAKPSDNNPQYLVVNDEMMDVID